MRIKPWLLFLIFFVAYGAFPQDTIYTFEEIHEYNDIPSEMEIAVIQEAYVGEGKVKFIDLPAVEPIHANVIFESKEGGSVHIAKYGSFPKHKHLTNFLGINILQFDGPFRVYLNLLGETPDEVAEQYYMFAHFGGDSFLYRKKVPAW